MSKSGGQFTTTGRILVFCLLLFLRYAIHTVSV